MRYVVMGNVCNGAYIQLDNTNMMTIGELKAAIANVPDNTEFTIELGDDFLTVVATRGGDDSDHFVITVE